MAAKGKAKGKPAAKANAGTMTERAAPLAGKAKGKAAKKTRAR